MMKLTQWASPYLLLLPLLLQWPTLAFANKKTLLRSSPREIDQEVEHASSSPHGEEGDGSHHHHHHHHHEAHDVIQEEDEGIVSLNMERALQATSRSCSNVTQWDDIIVLELQYNPSRCFAVLMDNRVYRREDNLFGIEQVKGIVRALETTYVLTYNWMQGQSKKLGDYCMHCDPYARLVTGASVTKVSKRVNAPILAFKMKVTYTCKGCATVITDVPAFDIPSLVQKAPVVGNCACTTMIGKNLTRAPHEAEFNTQYQQVIQSIDNQCFPTASRCGYGTPFTLDMSITVDVAGSQLDEAQRTQAVEAFMRASNTVYVATQGNCQPEFRRLETIQSHETTIVLRRLDEEEKGVSNGDFRNDDSGRALQKRTRMSLMVKVDGMCNGCTGKTHVGNRADFQRIAPETGKFRRLQEQVEETSNCYCPLGLTVATEPPGRNTLMRLFQEELDRINSPIKKVTGMVELSSGGRRVCRLQAGTPVPPPLDTENMTETLNDIPDPPSTCPMIKLKFTNFSNPMARWYGQSSTLQGGDYLFDQLWWTHGVKVSARIRHVAHSRRTDPWFLHQYHQNVSPWSTKREAFPSSPNP